MYEQYGENDQLKLFDIEQVVALSALHHFICPENNVEFLYPRLFNPNNLELDIETTNHWRCEVYQFPEIPAFEEPPDLAA